MGLAVLTAMAVLSAASPTTCGGPEPDTDDCCIQEVAFRYFIDVRRQPKPGEVSAWGETMLNLGEEGFDPDPRVIKALTALEPNVVPLSCLLPGNPMFVRLSKVHYLGADEAEIRVYAHHIGDMPFAVTFRLRREQQGWRWLRSYEPKTDIDWRDDLSPWKEKAAGDPTRGLNSCGIPTHQLDPPSWRVPRVQGYCLFDVPEDRDYREAGCTILIRPADVAGSVTTRVSGDAGEFDFGDVLAGKYLLIACSDGSMPHQAFVTVDPHAEMTDMRLYLKWIFPGRLGRRGS